MLPFRHRRSRRVIHGDVAVPKIIGFDAPARRCGNIGRVIDNHRSVYVEISC